MKVKFGDLLYIKGRIGWQLLRKDEYLKQGDYCLVTGVDIDSNHRINWNQCYYVSEERYNNDSKIQLAVNDIIVTKDGTIGKIALIDKLDKPATLNSHLFLIRNIAPDIMDTKFLYYVLQSNLFQKYAANNTSGSNIPAFTQKNISEFEINLPPLQEQKKIGYLLSMIESKIITNDRINATLESMAKTLYDYWFIQFDFPDENSKPYKTSGGKMVWNEELKREIPEGWEVKSIFECMDVLYGFPFDTQKFDDNIGNPVIRIRDILNNTSSAYTKQKIEDKYLTCKKDLLIGMDGNFHMNFWANNSDYINQRIVRIRDKENVSVLQVYFEILPYIKAKEKNVARSTVGHLSDKDIKELRILNSNNAKIYNIFNAIIAEICNKKAENKELQSLRDFLLPLLMNGQVGFKEE